MKLSNPKHVKTLKYIESSILKNGKSPSIRDIQKHLGYKSPRSAMLIVDFLEDEGWIKKSDTGGLQIKKSLPKKEDRAYTIDIPVLGLVSCGSPLFAEENIETYIPIAESLVSKQSTYFILRANGDSMNQAGIDDGDLVLIQQQNHAENGERVVALINDEATIKILEKQENFIVLQPKSNNPIHKPIIVSGDFSIQGKVVGVIKN